MKHRYLSRHQQNLAGWNETDKTDKYHQIKIPMDQRQPRKFRIAGASKVPVKFMREAWTNALSESSGKETFPDWSALFDSSEMFDIITKADEGRKQNVDRLEKYLLKLTGKSKNRWNSH